MSRSEQTDNWIRDSLKDELARRGRFGAVGQLVLAGLVAWSTPCATGAALAVAFAALCRLYLAARRSFRLDAFAALTVGGAVAWGILALELVRDHGLHHIHSHLAMLTLAGLAAAAANSLSPAPWLFGAFLLPLLGIPLVYIVHITGSKAESAIPMIFVCFGTYLAANVRSHYREIVRSIRAEAKSRGERDRMQAVLDTFPGVVLCVDPRGRYEYVSAGCTKIFGAAPQLGAPVGYTGRYPQLSETLNSFMKSGLARRNVEISLPTPAGEHAFLFCMGRLTQGPGSDSGVVLAALDVEERRQTESELTRERARAFFSAKMALLGEMAAGVAHEINNPLAVIGGHADHLLSLSQHGKLDQARTLRAASKIQSMVERIGKIVRGLRAFSRSDGSDPKAEAAVRGILEDTLELCAAKFHSAGVRIEYEAPSPGLTLECSAIQVSQVVLNLLSNASDAIAPLADRWIRVETRSTETFVEISITDSGAGIPKDLRDRILVPFFTTKPVGKGTGLGLSISKGICESHGGTLSIDTECPHTRFVVRLPLRQPSPAETRAA